MLIFLSKRKAGEVLIRLNISGPDTGWRRRGQPTRRWERNLRNQGLSTPAFGPRLCWRSCMSPQCRWVPPCSLMHPFTACLSTSPHITPPGPRPPHAPLYPWHSARSPAQSRKHVCQRDNGQSFSPQVSGLLLVSASHSIF